MHRRCRSGGSKRSVTSPSFTVPTRFGNFAEALAFTNRVGELAESIGHHPELVTEWGRVTVKWWSHKIKGLHELDFALAKRCDSLVEG